MAKSTHKARLKRSNAAHERLMRRPQNTDFDWINRNYHSAVLEKQKRIGRILTLHEKESIYQSTRRYFFN